MNHQVVITGIGAVTGFGYGAQALWEGLLEGRTSLRRISAFDPSGFRCQVASEVRDFNVRDHVPKHYRKATKVMARDIELAVGAAKAAIEDAGIITRGVDDTTPPTFAANRVGCQIGAGLIAAEVPELAAALATAAPGGHFSYDDWGTTGMTNLTPLWLLKYLPNMLACHVTIIHDARGPSNTITCAEASALLSIGESRSVIERGDADLCFSGGAESKINLMGVLRMDKLGRLAPVHAAADAPLDTTTIVRPFATDARGSILGEAGSIVMLESLDSARARGARIYAEAAGFGAGHAPWSDDPGVRAEGLAAAIENALEDASLSPRDIDAIVPRATACPAIDQEEIAALRAVFGSHLAAVPLITVTPNIGDTVASSGGVGVCVAALALHHQMLPARINAGKCPADIQSHAAPASDARLRHVLVCTGALGGQNAALILRSA
ncbi:MAG: hypothetical protein KDA21_00825 [Phycisphaerales bacterium]|nr:hypothetical protein [Phycisphaerales bacterium]